MNRNQVLLPIYWTLRPVVDRLHLNAVARPLWAAVWQRRAPRFIQARQNGRTWWLDSEVALRGLEVEVETIHWLRSVVRPGMMVIDVGANVGQMTLEMAHLVGPAGRVIAIEPGPGNLALLRRHVAENGFADRVQIVEAACCATHGGEAEIQIAGDSVDTVGNGFQLAGLDLRPDRQLAAERLKKMVPLISLDGFCQELGLRPAVMKIDVEGAEVEVLRGAPRVLAECTPALRIGFHPFAFADPARAQRDIEAMLATASLRPESGPGPWGLVEVNAGPVAVAGKAAKTTA